MKYEYQDIIVKTLIKEFGNTIDRKTLKTSIINVYSYTFGYYQTSKECESILTNLHIGITSGAISKVYNLQGSELCINFTVYEFFYPTGIKNHTVCHLDII